MEPIREGGTMKRGTRRTRVSKAGSTSRAEERDLSLSDTSPGLVLGPLDEESDDEVIEALDRLS